MSRVALYSRVSTGSEEQQQALEQQDERLTQAAIANGDNNPQRFTDVESGKRDDRQALTDLLAACRNGDVDVVIVTRLDRLSRSSAHGAELLRYFGVRKQPKPDCALDDSLDLSTPGGRFMARLLISWAEAESDRLAERTKHGHAYRRKLNKPFGPSSTAWSEIQR